MSIAASSIIQRCVDILQDGTSVRWPVNELIRYLNDGQREVALYRPDALVTNATITLVQGTKQSLPANASKLIEVVRNNTESSSRSVRLINREILDAQTSAWHELTPQVEILHYMYDPRDPTVFYVYPPASTSAELDLVYSVYPTDIAAVNEGATYSDVVGNLSVPDIYGNVIQDYILYRAYTKDSEYAGNAQRAQAHYQTFANALGIELQGTVQVGPRSVSNPNVVAPAAP